MSGTKALKPAEKVRIVRRCLEEGISTHRAGREVGVGQATIRRWIARYKAEGVEGFLPYERNRSYSPEFNHPAVRDYLSGKGSLQDICVNIKFAQTKIFEAGCGCIMLMEISTPLNIREAEAT